MSYGEPGVGKTAIAEGLALRIADGNVPQRLKNKEILFLTLLHSLREHSSEDSLKAVLKDLLPKLRKTEILFFSLMKYIHLSVQVIMREQ